MFDKDLVNVYENLTCSISTRLNSPGNSWKMDMNGLLLVFAVHSIKYIPCAIVHLFCNLLLLCWYLAGDLTGPVPSYAHL